jgi:Tol biopolymer transport system component
MDLETGESIPLDLSALPSESLILEEQTYELPRWPFVETWQPDGRTIIFNTMVDYSAIGPGGNVPSDDLWSADVESGKVHNLLAGEGEPATFALSPDGKWVLLNRSMRIEAYNLTNGERRILLEFTPIPTYSEYAWLPEPHWQPDSRHIHVAIAPAETPESNVFTLWRLDLDDILAQRIGQVNGSVFAWSPNGQSWSPDGTQLAYIQDAQRVLLTNLDRGETVQVTTGEYPTILGWSPDGTLALYRDNVVLYGVRVGVDPAIQRLGEIDPRSDAPLWMGNTLFMAAGGQLLHVATDGSGIEKVVP